MSEWNVRCDDCGRFMNPHAGGSWAEIYDLVGMQLSHTHFRCKACTATIGPAESNAKPCDGNMQPYQGNNQ